MSEESARLALPLLAAGQAQKEIGHNEALALLDMVVQAGVVSVGAETVPADPAIGACWVVGAAPGGAWAGHAHAIAGWTAGGWRFATPREGFRVWSEADAQMARYEDGAWIVGVLRGARLVLGGLPVVGSRGSAVADPVGGTIVDSEARTAIANILNRLRDHGLIAG